MRTLKPLLLFLLLIVMGVFTCQWLSTKKKSNQRFIRTTKDTIDIGNYSWQHMPDNAIGITRGDLSYLILAYNAQSVGQKSTTAVTCLPVENASDLLTAANYPSTRHYVYRSTKTWFRQNKKSHLFSKTSIDINNLISAHLLDSNSLLVVSLDTLQNALTFTTLDTASQILDQQSFAAPVNSPYKTLLNGASMLQVDSTLFLFAWHQPIAYKINLTSHHIKSYTITPGSNPHKSQENNPAPSKPLQSPIARYDFTNHFFYILRSPTAIHLPKKEAPIQYISYLDFYNKDFNYQYSIALSNLNPAIISDIAIFEEELYITAGRVYLSVPL